MFGIDRVMSEMSALVTWALDDCRCPSAMFGRATAPLTVPRSPQFTERKQ
jgi:hypothetical protein